MVLQARTLGAHSAFRLARLDQWKVHALVVKDGKRRLSADDLASLRSYHAGLVSPALLHGPEGCPKVTGYTLRGSILSDTWLGL